MESKAKDGEEENLQSAFKKLRVDADRSAVSLCSADSCTRPSVEDTKPKVLCSLKESWHGPSRKTTRGAGRMPRRRRSKSPVLHPPKFTHCSTKTGPPISQLKHKAISEPQDNTVSLGNSSAREFGTSCSPSTSLNGCRRFSLEPSGAGAPDTTSSDHVKEHSPISLVSEAALKAGHPSDFQSVSQHHKATKCHCKGKDCQCKHWQNMEVYSFSGLRDMLTECERSDYRTQTAGNTTSGSPRSCSEQARASVDDVTIEDLAGYMEYYLYIPKKMSHMAEMMYT
ncbi:oxidative stress-responsive serine-rich protein 1 [Discoglossus pictus]